jgi:hypothetical protein
MFMCVNKWLQMFNIVFEVLIKVSVKCCGMCDIMSPCVDVRFSRIVVSLL